MAENAKNVTRIQIPGSKISFSAKGFELHDDKRGKLPIKVVGATNNKVRYFVVTTGVLVYMTPFSIVNNSGLPLKVYHVERTSGSDKTIYEPDLKPGDTLNDLQKGGERFVTIGDKIDGSRLKVEFEIWFDQ